LQVFGQSGREHKCLDVCPHCGSVCLRIGTSESRIVLRRIRRLPVERKNSKMSSILHTRRLFTRTSPSS
jgi:hypothetical protein